MNKEDKAYYKDYRKQFSKLPYPPIFVTVDALVQHGSRVLLIERKNVPGKGQYALPGGFLNANERIEAGMWRELQEETGLKKKQLQIRNHIVVDTVDRSPRGRVISHAFRLYAPIEATIKVKASDDAVAAYWFALGDLLAIDKEWFFEDHFNIIRKFFL